MYLYTTYFDLIGFKIISVGWTDFKIFIGATDSVEEGVWLNTFGDKQTYFNWEVLEPNNGLNILVENCLTIDMIFGKWHDLQCTEEHRSVCEMKMI